MSKSVVSRVTQCLSDDFEVFRKRDLSSEELLYLELDGTFLRYHQGAEKKEPILVKLLLCPSNQSLPRSSSVAKSTDSKTSWVRHRKKSTMSSKPRSSNRSMRRATSKG